MDDSDQDFSFLCSRLLKRVRRKGGESGDEKKTVAKDEGEDEDSGSRIQSWSKAPCKRKREKKGGLPSEARDRSRTDGLGNEGGEPKVTEEEEFFYTRISFPTVLICSLRLMSRCLYEILILLLGLLDSRVHGLILSSSYALRRVSHVSAWDSSGFYGFLPAPKRMPIGLFMTLDGPSV